MKGKAIGTILLWVFTGLLAGSNLTTFYLLVSANQALKDALVQVDNLKEQTTAALDAMSAELEGMKNGTFDYTVNIEEEIPINTEIPVDFVVQVPINTVISINQTVTVPVTIPLYGQTNASVPIIASIPVNMTVSVPVQQVIPVSATAPVSLSVPINLKIGEMTIAQNMTNIQAVLDGLSLYLGGLTIP